MNGARFTPADRLRALRTQVATLAHALAQMPARCARCQARRERTARALADAERMCRAAAARIIER